MSSPAAPAVPAHFDSVRGWVTAVGAGLVISASFAPLYGFGVTYFDMAFELETGRGPSGAVPWLMLPLIFGSALISGPLYDRFGIKPLLLVGAGALGGVVVAMSHVAVLWHGFLLFVVGLVLGGGLFIAPLFALTALWFDRFRALALGVVAAGSAFGTRMFAPISRLLAEQAGWRAGMRWLAVICAAVFVLGLLLVRRPPSMPCGEPLRHVRRVLRTRSFWQMGFAGVCSTFAAIGTLVFFVIFAGQNGVPARDATAPSSGLAIASIFGYLALASLARPFGSTRLLKFALFGPPIACVLWYLAFGFDELEAKHFALVAFIFVLGVSNGGLMALIGDVAARLFGLVALGTVMGFLFFFSLTGALVGPALMGFAADATDSFDVPILLAGGVSAVGALVLLPLRRRPLSLPTYIGPDTLPPPPTSTPPAPSFIVPPPAAVPPPDATPVAAPGSTDVWAPLAFGASLDALPESGPEPAAEIPPHPSEPRSGPSAASPPEVFVPVPSERDP